MESNMKGWRCVRYGDALAWVEAPSAWAALRRSLNLYPLGDWTDDARARRVSPGCVLGACGVPRLHTRGVERRRTFGPPAAVSGLANPYDLFGSLVPSHGA